MNGIFGPTFGNGVLGVGMSDPYAQQNMSGSYWDTAALDSYRYSQQLAQLHQVQNACMMPPSAMASAFANKATQKGLKTYTLHQSPQQLDELQEWMLDNDMHLPGVFWDGSFGSYHVVCVMNDADATLFELKWL